MATKSETSTSKSTTKRTAADKAADNERDANDAIGEPVDQPDKDRNERAAAGAVDPADESRVTRPEDVARNDDGAAPHVVDAPGSELKSQNELAGIRTPNIVTTDPAAHAHTSPPVSPSPIANDVVADINVTADGMHDRVPPTTVDGRPLPVDHRGVVIADHGTIEPGDLDLADELDDHAARATAGDKRPAAAMRKAAGRLRGGQKK